MATSQVRSLPHCLDRSSWRLEAKTTALILLVLALLGLLGWLCLNQASRVSTIGHRIWEKERKVERLQQKNAKLVDEITEMLSVFDLMDRAIRSGYTSAEELHYLDVSGYAGRLSEAGLAPVPRLDESTIVAVEESGDEPLGVARWWEKVISQFVVWAGTQP